MQLKTLIFASLASLALGQVSSTSAAARPTQSSTCAAQNILEACLSTTKAQVNSCAGTDYDCLCTAYGVVLTCYNNCPSDPNVFGAQQNRDQFCAAATAYNTKTSSTRSGSATAAAATSTGTSTATRASSATASSASASAHSNAAPAIQVGSGVIAVALAGLGLLA